MFTDLVELRTKIGRDPSERPAARERESRYRAHVPERETTAALAGNDSVLEE